MDESTSLRVCTKCGIAKDLSEFSLLSGDPTKRRTGCKRCAVESAKRSQARIAASPKRIPASGSKACVRCGAIRPLDEFHRRSISTDGRSSMCKPCALAERRAYRAANPDKLRDYGKLWRAANPEHLETVRQWRLDNPDKVRAQQLRWAEANRERLAESKRQWYLANREYVLAWNHRNPEKSSQRYRRYREKNATKRAEASRRRQARLTGNRLGPVDVDALWTGSCALCGEAIDPTLSRPNPMMRSLDHIIPISRGGPHSQENLQWTHLVCNMRKGARPLTSLESGRSDGLAPVGEGVDPVEPG